MPTKPPSPIPIPHSTFPGANPQESAGRLINCTAEPLGEGTNPTGPASNVWRRQPGLSQFNLQQTGQAGYRGGIVVNALSYEAWSGNASTLDVNGNYTSLGAFPGTQKASFARNQASVPDVVAVDPSNGAYILASAALASATGTATIGGTTLNSGDTVSLFIQNIGVLGFPASVTYTLGAAETTTTIATGLRNLINANTAAIAAGLTATSAANVITLTQPGSIGNSTNLSATITGTGNETVTFSPSTGNLAGGSGTPGISGPFPQLYNAGGVLPQPNSVCFQDSYFFFTTGDGRCFATFNNSLNMNALTFIQVVSKSDVLLLRAIAFSGLLWLFTTGNCEIWQDTAQPYPGFPYSRLLPIEYGLVQPSAIAGWETGFSELIWVAQDFGVWWCTVGSTTPVKVSPPDLDRLIEQEVRAGNTLEAGCYIFSGKKFWTLSSPDWTWEFNVGTKKWNERTSLNVTLGTQVRWRGTGGHPFLNISGMVTKWLMGDTQSGNLLWVDRSNYTENGSPILFRAESGPVRDFPNQIRIARADFDWDFGVGSYLDANTVVLGTAAGTGGVIVLLVQTTASMFTGDTVVVTGVGGTTEANGTWTMTRIDATHISLNGSLWVHAWTSGGVIHDTSVPADVLNPVCAISLSKDGGYTWGNPLIRALGPYGRAKRMRASVKSLGLSGPQGVRWRVDVSSAVYVGLLGGSMSSDPREVGA
jgi:hypothetical protein